MNGLFDAILYAFCIKVLQGKAQPHECDFFARLVEKHGLPERNHSNDEWDTMVRTISRAIAESEFPCSVQGETELVSFSAAEAAEAYHNLSDDEKKELLYG